MCLHLLLLLLLLFPATMRFLSAACPTLLLLLLLLRADPLHAAQAVAAINRVAVQLRHEWRGAVEAHVKRLSSASSAASHLLQQQPQRVIWRHVIKQTPTRLSHGQLATADAASGCIIMAATLDMAGWGEASLCIGCPTLLPTRSAGHSSCCCCCLITSCTLFLHCCIICLPTAGPAWCLWAA
jgi:hypothetical protein